MTRSTNVGYSIKDNLKDFQKYLWPEIFYPLKAKNHKMRQNKSFHGISGA